MAKVFRFPFEQGELVQTFFCGKEIVELCSLFFWNACTNCFFQAILLTGYCPTDDFFLQKTIAGKYYAVMLKEVCQLFEDIHRLGINGNKLACFLLQLPLPLLRTHVIIKQA